jgi:large subunit ribosomal protein L6
MFYFLKMKDIFKSNLKTPKNIKLHLKNNLLFVQGNQGLLTLNTTDFQKKISSSFRLFQKMLIGADLGFVVRLAFVGVGFRVESVENKILKLKLGFSHFVFIKIPTYIELATPKKTLIVLKSTDDQLLNEFALKIRSFKLPDVYKGKGISFKNEILVLKEGKKK